MHLFSLLLRECLCALVFFTLVSVPASTCFLYYCVSVCVHLFSLLLRLCLRILCEDVLRVRVTDGSNSLLTF